MKLTHDMVKRDGVWRCVDCDRSGTIAEVSAVECPNQVNDDRRILDAIEGTGVFASDSSSNGDDQ